MRWSFWISYTNEVLVCRFRINRGFALQGAYNEKRSGYVRQMSIPTELTLSPGNHVQGIPLSHDSILIDHWNGGDNESDVTNDICTRGGCSVMYLWRPHMLTSPSAPYLHHTWGTERPGWIIGEDATNKRFTLFFSVN